MKKSKLKKLQSGRKNLIKNHFLQGLVFKITKIALKYLRWCEWQLLRHLLESQLWMAPKII